MADIAQSKVHLMYRVDIGFSEDRGYACVLADPINNRQKGIRGNSMEQLASRLRKVLIEEASKQKHFPLESESSERRIITPNGL